MTIVRDSFFINGQWVKATSTETLDVTDFGHRRTLRDDPRGHRRGGQHRGRGGGRGLPGWSNTAPKERAEFLTRISEKLAEYSDDLALIIANEVGMPLMLSKGIQVGTAHDDLRGPRPARRGVRVGEGGRQLDHRARARAASSAAITPWNYPLHQIANKVAPALAAGCTVVSEAQRGRADQRLHLRATSSRKSACPRASST